MKIVGGIEQPDAGEVLVDGARVVMRDVHAATSHGIAFIHQELNLLDNLDVAGNILLGREPTAWGPLRLIDRARMRDSSTALPRPARARASRRTRRSPRCRSRSSSSSRSPRRSRSNARVLIMDEPTSSLTLAETARLHDVVAGCASAAWRSSTSRTGSAKCRPSPIARWCCATARTPASWRSDELTHDNMVRLMVGRDIRPTAERRTPPTARSIRRRPRYFSVDGLRTRRYPQHAVSFAVSRGEILGMAGLVGAGRSEVARAIFGIEPRGGRNGRARRRGTDASPTRRRRFVAACSSCPRIDGPPDSSWTSRFARTCRCRRSAATRRTGSCPRAEERERVSAVCRAVAGQSAVDRGRRSPR